MDIETWHPLSVHFPIAFLSLSGLLSIYLVFKFNKSLSYFNLGLLILGIITASISLYTGDQEDGRVSRTICDPTVLKTHENYAYYMLWSFIALLSFWLIRLYTKFEKFRILISILIISSSLVGVGILVYVGHLGASLVYNQAAGVSIPNEDCAGFD